jgi:ribosomal protein S18 acetylase RimI-like enzyme
MTIRFATREDIPGMIELLKQVGRVHHEIRPDLFRFGAQKYDASSLEALLKDPNRPILIAGEQQVVGYAFCILRNIENDPVLCDRRELYIDDLCVDEACRGQGIATALYREVQALAKRLDCQAVTLNVWCGNESAMAFYEKLGMKPQKIGMEDRLC